VAIVLFYFFGVGGLADRKTPHLTPLDFCTLANETRLKIDHHHPRDPPYFVVFLSKAQHGYEFKRTAHHQSVFRLIERLAIPRLQLLRHRRCRDAISDGGLWETGSVYIIWTQAGSVVRAVYYSYTIASVTSGLW